MLPVNLVLTLLVALPPSLAALSGPGHRPPAGAHNLFAASNQPGVVGAGSGEEAVLDEGLWASSETVEGLELEELVVSPVNASATTDARLSHVHQLLHKRQIIKNPKVLQNPKWTGRPKPTTTTRPTSTTTSQQPSSTAPLFLPGPPRSGCAPRYTNTAGGAIYGPGLGNFQMLPRPSTFVRRVGSGLVLDGREYRIVGPNIYWLGLDENVNWQITYPDKGRVREAMAQSVALGANTIRAHTLGVSTGHALSLWPSAYTTNTKAFEAIDYAIWAARNYGLRLIIPLTDEHAYYHGGKYDFMRWAGADTSNGYNFYTSQPTIRIFKAYIAILLNHVNQFTGVALKDDPTIMAWETGNELGAWMLRAGAPPAGWSNDIGLYIKSLAPNQLVADGTDGLVTESGSLANTGVAVGPIDLVTDHLYPALQWLTQKDQGWMQYYTKNFYIGEMDWTGTKGGDDPQTVYNVLENWAHSGSMMWSVFGHDGECCNWITHNDGYSLYYPNGNRDQWGNLDSNIQNQIMKLMRHWYKMRGLTPPSVLPAVACPQPELLR